MEGGGSYDSYAGMAGEYDKRGTGAGVRVPALQAGGFFWGGSRGFTPGFNMTG